MGNIFVFPWFNNTLHISYTTVWINFSNTVSWEEIATIARFFPSHSTILMQEINLQWEYELPCTDLLTTWSYLNTLRIIFIDTWGDLNFFHPKMSWGIFLRRWYQNFNTYYEQIYPGINKYGCRKYSRTCHLGELEAPMQ